MLPDFSGNQFFNTLGNLALEPRAGLLIPDFASGDLLQVAQHFQPLQCVGGREHGRLSVFARGR